MADKRESLKPEIERIVSDAGLEYVGAEISKSDGAHVLRVYIDAQGGVRHEDCETVSRAISEYLDKSEEEGREWFKGHYFIEVTSPGVERPLFTADHYRAFVGKLACVTLKSKKKLTGVIGSVDAEGAITMLVGDAREEAKLAIDEVKRGHLVFVMEKGEKKTHSRAGSKKVK